MPEDFSSPIGIRSSAETQTWSLVVNEDGQFELRSNSPAGQGEVRLLADDETGRVAIGTATDPSELAVITRLNVEDIAGTVRLELDANGQRLQIRDDAGEIIATIGGAGSLRAGTNGEDGNLFLYPADADDISSNGQATASINAAQANMVLGDHGTAGGVFLQDDSGQTRARMRAGSQRAEFLNEEGEIIAMIGGAGNLRAGANGQDGNLFLYPAEADDIFNNGRATASINAARANMVLGGYGTAGDVFLQDDSGQTRARMRAGSQRAEFLNEEGEIIAMIGGAGNLRAGTNGQDGNLFLYPAEADDIFNTGRATASINAAQANMVLGDHGTAGDIFLQDDSGQTRARMRAGSQRAEFLNERGEIIAMIGGGANVRVGTNGLSGNMFLYDSQAGDIFDNGRATIALNGETGDIVLRNADCAEEFPLVSNAVAEPGQVVRLAEDGQVTPTAEAYDRRVAGIVAGAGDLRPGLVLGRDGSGCDAVPVAMMGRVWCEATSANGAIAIGDPVVSSDLVGHAMLATDPARAMGAIIGKAIDPLDAGEGLIRILVNLQ